MFREAFSSSGTRDSAPWHGLVGCRLRDRTSGRWGQRTLCRMAAPAAGTLWGHTHTSGGDALLHLGAQLREEHVLGRLLRRVIEENLKERKKSRRTALPQSPCDITLGWWHQKVLQSTQL